MTQRDPGTAEGLWLTHRRVTFISFQAEVRNGHLRSENIQMEQAHRKAENNILFLFWKCPSGVTVR